MKYEAKICPICGSTEIKPISYDHIGEDVCVEYACVSCDGVFKAPMPKKPEPKKPEEPAKPKIVLPEASSAVEIFKSKSKYTLEIACSNEKYVKFGSGVLLDSGDIISNAHLMRFEGEEECGDLTIAALFNGEEIELEVVAKDEDRDIVLFRPLEDIGTGVPIEPRLPDTGEKCFAIGNSKGQGISIYEGIVSANDRKVGDYRYVMFSAPVTQGNSGGPLFDSKGNLIGIVTFGREDAAGMNYAIPSKALQAFLYNAHKGE